MKKKPENIPAPKAAPAKSAAKCVKGDKPKVGRPPKYATAEDLEQAIQAYYMVRESQEKPITWTSLVYALGFADRQSMNDQEDRGEQFSFIIKRAKLKNESELEDRLFGAYATGSIFNLKANYGWKDAPEPEKDQDFTAKVID
jgi:hypothetical protein